MKDASAHEGLDRICNTCGLTRRYARDPLHRRRAGLAKMGITIEDYAKMLEKQDGVCFICSGVNPDGSNLAVDHDHSCCPGKGSCGNCVRTLLCRKCNTGLGAVDDSVDRLLQLIDYLRKF